MDLTSHVVGILDGAQNEWWSAKTVELRRELMDRRDGWGMRHGSLARTVLEGRLPGKKKRKRPKEMLLSWLLETSDEDIDYSQLKELAQG